MAMRYVENASKYRGLSIRKILDEKKTVTIIKKCKIFFHTNLYSFFQTKCGNQHNLK